MTALLQILSNIVSLVKDLPLKSKMIVLIILIILGGGIYSFVEYLDYKSEIEQIHANTEIKLAELETAKPDSVKNKSGIKPIKVKRIINKSILSIAQTAK